MLAKTQSQMMASELEKQHKGLVVELVIIKTTADGIQDKPLHEFGGKGLFTKEIELALLDGQIDLAVHSFKDVPVTQPLVDQAELVIAAVPLREDPRDVLASIKARSIDDLVQGAKVGTGSQRRRSQLLARRPDLNVLPLRGNIDTRLRKLREENFDGIILAAAGLRRAAMFNEDEMVMLPPEVMLPAPGQGALALQCRRSDERTRELLAALNDATTATCVTAERAIVAALEGDCTSPIAALAELEGDEFVIRAAVGARGGDAPVVRAEAKRSASQVDNAVADALKSLRDQGVAKLLRGA
jgi:hydroxymethylbilane synthase